MDGIGWVALWESCDSEDMVATCLPAVRWAMPARSLLYNNDRPVIVTRWADGTTPKAPAPEA